MGKKVYPGLIALQVALEMLWDYFKKKMIELGVKILARLGIILNFFIKYIRKIKKWLK